MSTSIIGSDVSFTWPDGDVVVEGLSFVIGPGRSALVGRNGTGKSTIVRLIAGELRPQRGSVSVNGAVGYLRQDLTLDTRMRVDQVLHIDAKRQALHAIEAGDVAERHFDVLGEDWDVEERAHATLSGLGLADVGLDRHVGALSGGQVALLGLGAQLLRRPDVLLLDEPTDNLDRTGRQRLYDTVSTWTGAMLVVSHDRDLLNLMDHIGDLRDGRITWYGGNYSAYATAVALEQEAAERTVRVAESDVRRQRRELVQARIKLDRRVRYGQKMWDNKREPKVVMGERKRQAQVAAGKHRKMHIARLEDARDSLTRAEEQIHDDADIRVDLPTTVVPAGRIVLTTRDLRLRTGQRCDLEVRGPERIALVGPNGAGKTTLLRTLTSQVTAAEGHACIAVPWRLLPQRLDLLDDSRSVLDNVADHAPDTDVNTVRAGLARFLFRGRRADQVVGTLSAGQRFRATLAALLLADPVPQLLMLDEPTNNLDLASVRQFGQALDAYRGALIVAGHDVAFLRSIGITRWLRLTDDLRVIDPM
ncbi:MAG TPA: ATP-binding cassette domain-containing protein [Jiangellaceae bacterium]|nr:ATP-binding cassette domain-containing protein [Jiangellaceae bacterium]